jgi:uracil-DNA glycosylase family 4
VDETDTPAMPEAKKKAMELGAKCNECPLINARIVYGNGPDKADILACGEAPGANEVTTGIPFTGRSGQLFDKVLEYHGIDRRDVYVTNACLCRPDGNKTPDAKAIGCCRDRLLQEIKQHNPKTILALGASAAKSILRVATGITDLRTEPYIESDGVRIIPTFHPAYALRNPNVFPTILADVGRINQPVQVGWEYTKFKVVVDEAEACKVLMEQCKYPELVCDIENDYDKTKPNNPHDVNFLCVGISHKPGYAVVYAKRVVDHPVFQAAFRRALRGDYGNRWGWQFGKFDIQRLWKFAPEAHVDEDSGLMSYACDERTPQGGGGHDLELLATTILHAPKYKTDAKKWLPYKGASLKHLPLNVLYEYNAGDCDISHRLFEPLRKEMRSDGTEEMYRRLLIEGSNVLARVEYRGVRVDVDGLERLSEDFSGTLGAREAELARWVKNPRSWQQIMAALKEMGYDVPDTRKDTLQPINEDFIEKLLDYKKFHKLLTTYVQGLRRRSVDGVVYSNFNLHTTETGRLSSTNPNLQNIPIGSTIRDMLIARNGYTLVSADYAGIEGRVIAELANDPYLLEAYKANRNLHQERAIRLFTKDGYDPERKDDYSKRLYVTTKSVFFGSIYEETAKHLAARLGVMLREAMKIQADIFDKSPRIKKYWKEVEAEITENGYLRSKYGRLRRFWLVTRENFHDVSKEGVNFKVQSPASDLTLEALINLTPVLEPDAFPIITVHDELTFESREEAVPDVSRMIKRVMEDTPMFEVPMVAEVKVGKKWGSKEEVKV